MSKFLVFFIVLMLNYPSAFAHVDMVVLYAVKNRCMVCHDTYEKTQYAPPLIAVKKVYMHVNDRNITKAHRTMVAFLMNPTKETALMRPAVELFGVMPNLDLQLQSAEDFASAILETQYDSSEWLDSHFKEHQERGFFAH